MLPPDDPRRSIIMPHLQGDQERSSAVSLCGTSDLAADMNYMAASEASASDINRDYHKELEEAFRDLVEQTRPPSSFFHRKAYESSVASGDDLLSEQKLQE